MLFGEIIAVYCEDHGKHAEKEHVKECGTYSNHWAFKG
jgi:hypothetical protein